MSADGQNMSDGGAYSLTPEQATAKLAEMSAALHGPAPSATPQNADEARARLQAISADEKWRSRYLSGHQAERAEFETLTKQVAGSADGPDVLIETIDSVSDPHSLPRAGYAALFDGLRENTGGLPNDVEEYMRQLDSGEQTVRPTEGDRLVCQETLDRLMKNPGWTKKVLDGDARANAQMNALVRTISYAAEDGQPVSEVTTKWIAENITGRI
jgi:hypothetical protein